MPRKDVTKRRYSMGEVYLSSYLGSGFIGSPDTRITLRPVRHQQSALLCGLHMRPCAAHAKTRLASEAEQRSCAAEPPAVFLRVQHRPHVQPHTPRR